MCGSSINHHCERRGTDAVSESWSPIVARRDENDAGEHGMPRSLFHVYGDSPYGREELLQSAYLVRKTQVLSLAVYVPRYRESLMYCDSTVFTLNCERQFSRDSNVSRRHVLETLPSLPVNTWFFQPDGRGAGGLPEIPVTWALLAYPVSLAAQGVLTSWGHLERAVASIAWHTPFPVFFPTPAFLPWQRVVALCVGSQADGESVEVARAVADLAHVPLTVYADRHRFEQIVQRLSPMSAEKFDVRHPGRSLYKLPADSLLVVAAKRRVGLVRGLAATTHLARIRAGLPNPMLLVGPNCENGPLGRRHAAGQDGWK